VALVGLGVIGFFMIRAPMNPPLPTEDPDAGTVASAGILETPRCRSYGPSQGHRIGAAPKLGPDAGSEPKRLEPFAVEVGRGASIDGGFAVGVKHQRRSPAGQATIAAVAVLDAKASKVDLVELETTRADMDAPLVVGHGGRWIAAMLEPNASGLALRLVQQQQGNLRWGAELPQGRDESLAFDMAFGERTGVVVWDDVSADGDRATVMLAAVDGDSLQGRGRARAVSAEDVHAELPRIIARPGGFWVSWVARAKGEVEQGERPEGRFAAERIDNSWLEVLMLDADGKAQGNPRAITSKDDHVLVYDIEPGKDGAAMFAWRDDDTPSGAQGGRVTAMLVEQSGAGQMQLVAEDKVGAGVPTLLGRWIALPDGRGAVRLAPMTDDGQLAGELQREPVVGIGQLLGANDDVLLIARPSGKSVQLVSVACDRAINVAGAGGARVD